MDFNSLKQQIEASRRIDVAVNGSTFHLRMPTEHAWRVAIEGNRDSAGRVLEALAFRELLNAAVVGWDGVKTTDLLGDAPEEALHFSKEACAELLDTRQDIVNEIVIAIAAKIRERREKRETERKN